MLLGRFALIEDEDERLAAMKAFTDRMLPGRWDEVRPPDRKELKATTDHRDGDRRGRRQGALRPVRATTGRPDAELDAWAGVVPILTAFGEPEPSPGLRPEITLERRSPWVTALTTSTS